MPQRWQRGPTALCSSVVDCAGGPKPSVGMCLFASAIKAWPVSRASLGSKITLVHSLNGKSREGSTASATCCPSVKIFMGGNALRNAWDHLRLGRLGTYSAPEETYRYTTRESKRATAFSRLFSNEYRVRVLEFRFIERVEPSDRIRRILGLLRCCNRK